MQHSHFSRFRPSLVLAGILSAGCASPDSITVLVSPELAPLVDDFVACLDSPRVSLVSAPSPVEEAERHKGTTVVLLHDDSLCGECYRMEGDASSYQVLGGAPLGLQYGLAHLLELAGFRFTHPHRGYRPASLNLPLAGDALDRDHAPAMSRRGLHLHTLHPTDALFDFWTPSEDGLQRAGRVLDWVVKNRGNHLQWMGLDDIGEDEEALTAWREHTSQILDMAHARGVTVGLGVELFGSGNLQQAFDLLDEPTGGERDREAMAARLDLVTEGLPWDVINLSFGEFFAEEPDKFISSVDLAWELVQERLPDPEMVTWIHIGDDVRVEYQGEEIIYYFLVKYADPAITRSVHTVMYYNLFDDAGGAYHHDDFSDHKEFLVDLLRDGEPVNYFPETSYWVAFDNSIPMYLPLYAYSRWRDMALLQDVSTSEGIATLDDHVTFTTGWEWGYWMHDYLVLRMNWEIPEDWRAPLHELFAAWGETGLQVAELVGDLAELQHRHLIEDRLAAWLCSRDNIMEAGYLLDIVSQPRRPGFDELAALEGDERERLLEEVLAPLGELASETDRLLGRLERLPLAGGDPWLDEVRDGFAVTALRTRFVEALYQAALSDRDEMEASLSAAEEHLEAARMVVARRHAALHDPEPGRLLVEGDNPTIYNYGYLIRAHELCFWERELAQAVNVLRGEGLHVAGCGL